MEVTMTLFTSRDSWTTKIPESAIQVECYPRHKYYKLMPQACKSQLKCEKGFYLILIKPYRI